MPRFYSELQHASLENLASDITPGVAGRFYRNTTDGEVKVDSGAAILTVVTETQTQTLTNKTIDADSNTITNIENADIKSGAAIDASKIADGSVSSTEFQYISTLSSNAQDQLDAKIAKSLVTTKGDLIATTGSATPVRLAVGTDGNVLKADSGAAAGVSWGSASANLSYRSVTTTDTCTSSDDVLILSGASFTQNLFTAAGNTGKVLTIKHNGSNLTQVYTIDPNGAQTINGAATYILYTNGETIRIVSDGTNWQLLESRTITDWVDSGAVTITATTTSPTKASGITVDKLYWRRNGKNCDFRLEYLQSNTTSAAAGSGDYLWALPTDIVADTSTLTLFTTVIGASAAASVSNAIGSGSYRSGATNAILVVTAYNSVRVRMSFLNTTTFGMISDSIGLTTTNFSVAATFSLPITGWNP